MKKCGKQIIFCNIKLYRHITQCINTCAQSLINKICLKRILLSLVILFLTSKKEQNQGLRESAVKKEKHFSVIVLRAKDTKSQEIAKWLYKFTVLINKIFYRGKTDVKFCLIAIGKGFQWKQKEKANYYQGFFYFFFSFIFFCIILVLVSPAEA